MDIEKTSLMREVLEVIKSPVKPVHFTWRAEIHVGNLTFPCLKVISIDDLREFDTNYAEEVMLEVAIGRGTFAYQIYPFNDNLDITLYRIPLGEVSNTADGSAISSERYTATLVDEGNFALEANGANTPSQIAMDLADIYTAKFQLVDKAVEQLRMMSTGNNYRGTTTEDVIRGVLTNESRQINVDEAKLPKGVEMVKASNQNIRDHVIIPHGIRLVDVPQYVHNHCGGVYSAGLGYFLQNNYWYVYPCWDTERFNDATHTMSVINVPRNKFPHAERTYNVVGSHLTILATGDVKFTDDSNIHHLNFGNGARFADANAFLGGFVETKGNKTTAARARNNSEFISSKAGNGNNNVQLSDKPINANPYLEYSKMARRDGAFLQVVWENSNQSLLFPGMMAKIMYLEGEEVKEIFGSLLKVHHYDKMAGEGLTNTRYISYSILVFFVNKPKNSKT